MRKTFFGSVVREFTFPDGQPHIEMLAYPSELRCRIASSDDLLKVCLVLQMYRQNAKHTDLQITYLLGERMDKPNSAESPVTAEVVCSILNHYQDVATFYLLSPHSSLVVEKLGAAVMCFEEDTFHDVSIKAFLKQCGYSPQGLEFRYGSELSIVFPDKGARSRLWDSHLFRWWPDANVVTCQKQRDISTGWITGFSIEDGVPRKYSVILDDLCDGGATFKLAAECLKDHGSEQVGLSVVKGVFSKGTTIENVDFISTTNAYQEFDRTDSKFHVRNYI